MKFNKGDSEKWLWEYLHYNIFDCFDDKDILDNTKQKLLDNLLSRPKKLSKDIEIIIKINGKVIDSNAWEIHNGKKIR